MGKMQLDIDTADRILTGLIDPGDAPPGYAAAVELLAAARTPSAPVHVPAVAARRPSAPLRSRRRTMIAATPFRPRLPIIAAAIVIGAGSGAAYAAGLPAAAASTAHGVLRSLGLRSGAGAHRGSGPASTHGATVSTLARSTTATGSAKGAAIAAAASAGRSYAGGPAGGSSAGTAGTRSHGHGATISALAHSTSGTAGAKGATISAAASGGKSHAGQHGHNGKSQNAHGHGAGKGHNRS
jgi:hypothetical protein